MNKRALILSSEMGGGHETAAAGLSRILDNLGYEPTITDFYEIFGRTRLWRHLSSQPMTTIYNGFVLQRGHTGPMWLLLAGMSKFAFSALQRFLPSILDEFLRDIRPDAVISVLPLINKYVAAAISRNCPDVPFVTASIDFKEVLPGTWIQHSSQRVLCFSHDMAAAALKVGIQPDKVICLPTPVLPFEELRDALRLDKVVSRREHGIPADETVALLSFGSQGADRMCRYIGALLESSNLFLICLCGKNEHLFAQLISRVPANRGLVVGYTRKVLSLLQSADFVIGKPGSYTLWESIISSRPLLLEFNWATLIHERYNAKWAISRGFAVPFAGVSSLLVGVGEMERRLNNSEFDRAFAGAPSSNERDFVFAISKLMTTGV